MNIKAIGKYFLDINMFNIPFSFVIGLTLGVSWSIITFSSIGILIGYLGFYFFKEQNIQILDWMSNGANKKNHCIFLSVYKYPSAVY